MLYLIGVGTGAVIALGVIGITVGTVPRLKELAVARRNRPHYARKGETTIPLPQHERRKKGIR